MLIRHVVVCAFAILFATGATSEAAAHVVFQENFNGENGGHTAYGYQGSLLQFEAQVGSVDLIGTDNTLGLVGDGAFLNLNGFGGPTLGFSAGGVRVNRSFSVAAGDLVTLSFRASGNQRSPTSDDGLQAGIEIDAPLSIADFTAIGPTSTTNFGNFDLVGGIATSWVVGYRQPFKDYSVTFRALSPGRITPDFAGWSQEGFGPLLDDVTLSIGVSAIPEPSAWALMLLGFSGIGVALRGRHDQPRRAAT